MSPDVFELSRALRDVQSQVSRITSRLGATTKPDPVSLLLKALIVRYHAHAENTGDYLAVAQRLFDQPIERLGNPLCRAIHNPAKSSGRRHRRR